MHYYDVIATRIKVPESVKKAAKRGLDLRAKAPPSRRGGLDPKEAKKLGINSGVSRARQLIRGTVAPKDIKAMRSFFARHSAYKHKHKTDPGGKAHVSWLIWGGDPGRAFAEREYKKFFGGTKVKASKMSLFDYYAQEELNVLASSGKRLTGEKIVVKGYWPKTILFSLASALKLLNIKPSAIRWSGQLKIGLPYGFDGNYVAKGTVTIRGFPVTYNFTVSFLDGLIEKPISVNILGDNDYIIKQYLKTYKIAKGEYPMHAKRFDEHVAKNLGRPKPKFETWLKPKKVGKTLPKPRFPNM